MDNAILIVSFSSLLTGVVAYAVWKNGSKLPLPPGPPAWPILGNVLDIPATEPWIAYKRLSEKYGDVLRIRLFTKDAIILNSFESVKDLLEQRSHNYSSRPYVPATDLMDFSWNTAFLPYSDEWRLHRKIFHQSLRPEGALMYRPMQMKKARELVTNIMEAPATYLRHLRTFSTSVIMSATYGYNAAPLRDPLVEKMKAITLLIVSAVTPECSAAMSAFPFLMYIPPWFPGAVWQRTIFSTNKLVDWWLDKPFQYSQDTMAQGMLAPCMVGDALSQIDNDSDAATLTQVIKGAAATSFAGASDSTDAVLQVFVLAMVLFPDIQKRAQDEIQAVVGTERLPTYSDRPHLPYIEAVVRETLRWHPITPLAIPHSTVTEDTYRGYFIPKGVTIIPNVWAIAHDEAKYPDPFIFNPSRFFDKTGRLNEDTVSYAFGFGRRICVGRYLADSSMWSAIANLLVAFSFEAPLDENGQPIKITPQYTTGVTSHPKPFPVKITPRLEAEKFASLAQTDD